MGPSGAGINWRDLVLPGFAAPLTRLGKIRREALVAHLKRILPSSFSAYGLPPPPLKAVQSSHDPEACRTCQGYCCRNGGDMAFLTDQALRIVWSERPRLSKDELIAAYTDAVPDVTFDGSCIFHAEQGCSLPNRLRSEICQTYLCDPLKSKL